MKPISKMDLNDVAELLHEPSLRESESASMVATDIPLPTAAPSPQYATETHAKAGMLRVSWPRTSWYLGRVMKREVSIVEVAEGGRASGEGSGHREQWIAPVSLSDAEAEVIASLIQRAAMPVKRAEEAL